MSTTSEVNENLGNSRVETLFLDAANAFESFDDDADTSEANRDTFFGFPVVLRGDIAVQLNWWADDFLDKPIVTMTAPHSKWGEKSRWADGSRGWKRRDLTVKQLAAAFNKPQIVKEKDGDMFMAAELSGVARRADNVTSIGAMIFDSDQGQPISEIVPALQAFGRCYTLYTSFSHGKSKDEIPMKALKDFDSNISDNPSDADVQRYLRAPVADGGKGYHPCIVDTARVVNVINTHDPFSENPDDGKFVVEITHAPMTKCRIVMILAEPFVIGEDRFQSAKEWRALYNHIGNQLGFWFDRTGADVNRAFYSARAKSLDNYLCVIGGETPLVLPEVTPEMLSAVENGKKTKRAVREARQAAAGDAKPVEGVPDIERFLWAHGEEFDGAAWLSAAGWEFRDSDSDLDRKKSKRPIRCPNEHKHTPKPNDLGCVAMHPDAGYGSKFRIVCRHNSCQGFETEDFLQMICEEILTTSEDATLPALENFLLSDSQDESTGDAPSAEAETTPASETKAKFHRTKALLKKSNFKINAAGWIEVKKDNEDPKAVCHAFETLGLARSESSIGWKLLIEFDDPDGVTHRDIISDADFGADPKAMRRRLSEMGFKIKPGMGMTFEYLLQTLQPKERILLATRPGWFDGKTKFITPDGQVIGGGSCILENPLSNQRAGTLEDQLRAWEIAIRHGGPHHFLSCLMGCAGALVAYVDLDSSPVVTFSGLSSSGKTTGLMFSASGFGQPKISKGKEVGLLHSLRSTPNAVEYLAERSNGTFLGLDETAHFDNTKLEELMFMLAGGSGKHRMKTDSGARDTKGWRTCVGLSSEHPLGKLVAQMGRSARVGFSARVADVDVSKAKPIPEVEYLEMMRLLSANYGHIGPKFVEHILASGVTPEVVRAAIDDKATALAGKGASPLVWRSAGVFAVLWQVGEMLGEAGLLPDCLADGEGERRIREIWTAYQSSAESEALNPTAKAIQTLRESLVARMGRDVHPRYSNLDRNKFTETVAWFDEPEPSGDAFADENEEVTRFYVRSDKLAELAGDTIGATVLCEALEKAGVLERYKDGKFSHRKIAGVGAVRHYPLDFSCVVDDEG